MVPMNRTNTVIKILPIFISGLYCGVLLTSSMIHFTKLNNDVVGKVAHVPKLNNNFVEEENNHVIIPPNDPSSVASKGEESGCPEQEEEEKDDNKTSPWMSVQEFEGISHRILGPDAYDEGCPSDCGCPETPIDCPRHYQIEDIKLSAEAKLNTNAVIYFAALMERKHMEMVEMCNGDAVVLKSGGWCLSSTSEERGTIE